MWLLIQISPDGTTKTFYLPIGKNIIGRKGTYLKVEDRSVSRKHCEIEVSPIKDVKDHKTVPAVTIKDMSKFGTIVNSKKIPPSNDYTLNDGDVITLGDYSMKYQLKYHATIASFSGGSKLLIPSIVEELSKIGGFFAEEAMESTVLIMNRLEITPKVIIAVVRTIPIVTMKWIKDISNIHSALVVPDASDYLPEVKDDSKYKKSLFLPDERRKSLFNNMTFITLKESQKKKISDVISLAGGQCILWQTRPDMKDEEMLEYLTEMRESYFLDPKEDPKSDIFNVVAFIKKCGIKFTSERSVGDAIMLCDESSLTRSIPTLEELHKLKGSKMEVVDEVSTTANEVHPAEDDVSDKMIVEKPKKGGKKRTFEEANINNTVSKQDNKKPKMSDDENIKTKFVDLIDSDTETNITNNNNTKVSTKSEDKIRLPTIFVSLDDEEKSDNSEVDLLEGIIPKKSIPKPLTSKLDNPTPKEKIETPLSTSNKTNSDDNFIVKTSNFKSTTSEMVSLTSSHSEAPLNDAASSTPAENSTRGQKIMMGSIKEFLELKKDDTEHKPDGEKQKLFIVLNEQMTVRPVNIKQSSKKFTKQRFQSAEPNQIVTKTDLIQPGKEDTHKKLTEEASKEKEDEEKGEKLFRSDAKPKKKIPKTTKSKKTK
eukprot:TRINITY_DN6261_c0_g1_i2.p1 TRINITY_DN6261_c0_g1~~TRINITY_DN6261_c0_g1_i2.p1  ORF type:complete len:653 (+),score=135.48 TRINITY_DN6261_c0_g1_i2:52-2010(+)